MTLIRFAFNRGIPPPCRAWFLEGALSHSARMGIPPPSASSDRYSYRLGVGPHSVQVCCGWCAGSAVRFLALFQPPTAESCSSRPRTQTDNGWVAAWPLQSSDRCLLPRWDRNRPPHYLSTSRHPPHLHRRLINCEERV